MIAIAWLIVFIAAFLYFQKHLDEQFNLNQQVIGQNNQGLREIKLKRNRSGHFIMNGLINHYPVVFLVDTGATQVAIPMSIAKQLSLKIMGEYQVSTAAGYAKALRTRLQSVGVGNIELKNVSASVIPSMTGNEVLLGMSFLKQFDMIFEGKYLTIREK